ncbi:MAG TPA: aromatic ring-hydroxylating dioxygenase subunit alpha [Acinetobacter ursingii]|nr:aromatic ring-hydroxylating dioxygenase subunit alpha [Acinetobacter ursingii]MCH2006191.1 aromatic ring-hydroxylating dioxygenase subunit alpha [Acinetobacter ursingii]MCU4382436.1 aromatic ring-hydroxylating dioxygenase subunit alpha [Acinetobacter ursingii]MCU4611028.1 aromatic ring-hydroxylating dioxygenase subunit alpha [Acinetobacter ursingii]MDU4393901.1 aromatic ring-hydroxylating dioxygenase subunit alpha [Acinetobacter ursingii]HCO09519.1 aromatic ring-hydroxylating dioxygenase su
MNAIPVINLINKPCNSQFEDRDWEILSQHWYPVARIEDVSTQPQQVTLLDVKMALYKTESGDIHLVRDICPHRGVPLTKGWVEGEEIVCPYHGLRYNAAGQCTKIPAQPELTKISDRFRLSKFPVVQKYGLIWTSIQNRDVESAHFPVLDTWEDPAHQAILPPYVDIAGSSGRQLEGFIDVAHFAWVHHEAFASRENPVVPKYSTIKTDYGLQTEYVSDVSNYPHGLQHLAPEGFLWKRVFDVYPPFSAILTVHFPHDGILKILNACCPISHNKTRLFVPLTRNFDTTGDLQAVYDFNAQIFAEDQDMVEAQKPEELPLDLMMEAHFEADRSSTMYRRILADLGLSKRYTV